MFVNSRSPTTFVIPIRTLERSNKYSTDRLTEEDYGPPLRMPMAIDACLKIKIRKNKTGMCPRKKR